MPLGYPVNAGTINNNLGDLAVRLRQWAFDAGNMHTPIASLGADDPTRIAALQTLGYSEPDAAEALRLANVLWTVAALYYGQAAQPTPYNFDDDLSKLWGIRG
jgi:hypothetical protein